MKIIRKKDRKACRIHEKRNEESKKEAREQVMSQMTFSFSNP